MIYNYLKYIVFYYGDPSVKHFICDVGFLNKDCILILNVLDRSKVTKNTRLHAFFHKNNFIRTIRLRLAES